MKIKLVCSLTVVAFAAVTALSCNVYDADLVDQASAGVPPKPPASTSSSDDDIEAVFAFYNISLDQSSDRWRHIGLDLDGMNTDSTDAPAECVSSREAPTIDGANGIDNSTPR